MSQITPARIVLYTLSENDARLIEDRRAISHIGHGNAPSEGDVVPMLVVRVWPDGVNGQAFLDGDDVLWVTSRPEGAGPGTWAWPARTIDVTTYGDREARHVEAE